MAHLGDVIAANVRGERARRRWTQAQLAERLGWERSSVGHLETGRRAVKASDIPDLCKAFGFSLSKLIEGAADADRRAMQL